MTRIARVRNTLSFNGVRLGGIVLLVIVLFGVAYLGQASQATLTGQRVHDLQDKLDRIERQNAQLEYEIATELAPEKIQARAKAMGLRPATSAQARFMTVTDYPNPTPTVIAPERADAGESTSSFDLSAIWKRLTGGALQSNSRPEMSSP